MPLMRLDPFASKPSIYTSVIVKLQDLQADVTEVMFADSLTRIIKKVKIAFEDHLQGILEINEDLRQLVPVALALGKQTKLMEIIHLIDLSENVNPSEQDRYKNYNRRRFESDLALNMLFFATDTMMKSVQRVSERFILLIEQNKPECFALALADSAHNSARSERFGCFDHIPTLIEVKELLRENSKKKLPQILLMHFLLWWSWQNARTEITLTLPEWEHQPNGHFINYIQERLRAHDLPTENLEYFRKLLHENACELDYFGNIHMYKSAMYHDRGQKLVTQRRSNCVGLLLEEHDRGDLQHFSEQNRLHSWGPDVLMVDANFETPYVKNILAHDGVYICGVSGLSTLFLSLMETLGNFSDSYSKQNYVAAFSAYIAAGGHHSFHEVFLPCDFFLKLIPGYHAELPTRENNFKTKPPNYSAFFDIFSQDEQFTSLHEKAWTSYLADYRKRTFLSDLQPFSIFAPSHATKIKPNDTKIDVAATIPL